MLRATENPSGGKRPLVSDGLQEIGMQLRKDLMAEAWPAAEVWPMAEVWPVAEV